ncbi:MAG: insulinase family protein [Bacteroidales bacterium]|nr:insulinase family protein [Bacteroidales bacterium]
MIRVYYLIIIFIFSITTNIGYSQVINIKAESPLIQEENTQKGHKALIRYTLKNGLTVYLNPDKNMTKVVGAIVVKGGAKADPADATGIAHYLEHMLFKGTDKIGTIDYKSERVWLDSIAFMYSMLEFAKDDTAYRNRILKKVDYYSVKADKFAIPGEFAKTIELIGGRNLNAYTDFEKIVYHNEFPANYMKEWLMLYRERTENAVFRLFKTELETVFEEKNMSQDNTYNRFYEEVYRKFYPNSVYGNQTVLGSPEHLKNPSIYKMQTYFKEHYNAKNMALILVGNFEVEPTRLMIEEIFGQFRQGNEMKIKQETEAAFSGREEATIKMTPIPMGVISYRIPGQNHKDIPAIDLIIKMLNNENNTGLLDSLIQEDKLMLSMAFTHSHSDLGGFFIGYVPNFPMQSCKKAEKKVSAIIKMLREGKFSESFLAQIKQQAIKNHQQNMELGTYRTKKIADLFVSDGNWQQIENYDNIIENISKNDIMNIANTYLNNNYLVIKSKIGSPKKNYLKKPKFTPFKADEEKESIYFQKLLAQVEQSKEIDLSDFQLNYQQSEPKPSIKITTTQNPYNDVFNYKIIYYIGNYDLKELSFVASYMNEVGTADLPVHAFRKKLQSLGTTINFIANESFLIVEMTGFDRNYKESMAILSKLLKTPEVSKKALQPFDKERTMSNRIMKHDSNIKSSALVEYSLYGDKSKYLNRLSAKEIKRLKPSDLIGKLHEAMNYKADIIYSGTIQHKEIVNATITNLPFSKRALTSNSPVIKPFRQTTGNTIYFLNDKKALQNKMSVSVISPQLTFEDKYMLRPYNHFFGVGLNSVVFKEIREYRSLAYSALGIFSTPYKAGIPGLLFITTATQYDKTPEAISTVFTILDKLEVKSRLDYIIPTVDNMLLTDIPNFRQVGAYVFNYQLQGFNGDAMQQFHTFYQTMKPEMITGFHQTNISNRNKTITMVGKKEILKTEEYTKFGTIKKVRLNQLYVK